MNKEKIFRLVLITTLVFLVYQFGFRPMFVRDKKVIDADRKYWSELLSTDGDTVYDVIVYGAEPQGVAAAISSARLGARTLLISEEYDMGGLISRCLVPELEIPTDKNGRMLNGGILEELGKALGECFTSEQYIAKVNEMIQAEKDLDAIIGSSLAGVSMSGKHIDSVEVRTRDGTIDLAADIYIDASDSGALLELCKVPYFTGSADLNLNNSFMPVSLNFEMVPASGTASKGGSLKGRAAVFNDGTSKYKPQNENIRLEEPRIFFMPDGKAIISGIQVTGVNVLDDGEMKTAYKLAVDEAKRLSAYLSENFVELKGHTFSRAAGSLRVRESKHYAGRYVLSVNDVFDGVHFADTAAKGSYPVLLGKFSAKGSFVAGKPDHYSIPLRCLVPVGTTNLLMAGPRISCSSLAASSTYAIGTCIAEGEAAGAAAVVCAARNESPAFLEEGHEYFEEFTATLAGKDMYLPEKAVSLQDKNWSAEAARRLVSLGLIAGGSENDFRYSEGAAQKDLAYILINGIYRLDRNSYSEEINKRLQPFINSDSLTFDSLMRVLGALYEIEGEPDALYEKLCRQGRINGVFMDKLGMLKTNAEVITLDMVYYIGAYSISSYTGESISDETLRPLFASDPGT
jgi:hypothetical protein